MPARSITRCSVLPPPLPRLPSKNRTKLSKTWVVLAALPGAALPACTQAGPGPVPGVISRQSCKGPGSGTGEGADTPAPAPVPAPSPVPGPGPGPGPVPGSRSGTHRSSRPLWPCDSASAICIATPPGQHSPAPAEGLAGSLARGSAGKAARGDGGDGGAGVWGLRQGWGCPGRGARLRGAAGPGGRLRVRGAKQSSFGVLQGHLEPGLAVLQGDSEPGFWGCRGHGAAFWGAGV